MVLLFAAILFGGLVFLLGFLLWISPGKPSPFLDSAGNPLPESVSEKVFVQVGGVRQGMFIRSKNIHRPVLLYLHGGPSFPNYFLIDKHQPGLEDYFSVCYWEQRGGGLSYSPEVDLQSMSYEQLVADAVEVTHYLRKRFGKEKIYLLAHSGGTPIALQAAAQNPQLYEAYMAMAQITDQAESEKIAYEYMMQIYQQKNDHKSFKQMKQYPILEKNSLVYDFYTSPIRDRMMHELGIGTMREMKSIFKDVFIPVWTCMAYTLAEKINIWRSKFFFLPKTNLPREVLSRNFAAEVPKLDIPIYFFSGRYDYTVNRELSKAYFRKLEAPLKGFYTFENSAHSPLFEENKKMRLIIERDVLNGRLDLADKE
ncbi:alpha/beta hydrolase [Cyclobacterium jeungdonense]|uniref:Alpha/beta hydrolase n=1 Tax=Cyclobacterium jeungdonense TaxID=708087 RepID=A0ABT8C7G7_9BACT|nr:alpha/beta hydrolase [Cyclobacterium jeungdonense]MDN3687753.1 alpha/beta hydrolase [Cyclobacterium jeungdonense]